MDYTDIQFYPIYIATESVTHHDQLYRAWTAKKKLDSRALVYSYHL